MTIAPAAPAPRASARRRIGLGLLLGLLLGGVWLLRPPVYAPRARTLPTDFDAFYQQRLAESRARGARPGNEERLLRFAPQTPLALLYLHGFSASRAEGEAVIDAVAQRLRANTYYLRLPGHGTSKEDHARATFADYLDEVSESARMVRGLGQRLVLIGTSTGALLATWLAAAQPEQVAALVLASPLFEFGDHTANLLAYPGGVTLAERMIGGPVRRVPIKPGDPDERRIPGAEAFWYTEQYVAALRPLAQLKRLIARPAVFERVRAPALMLTYEGGPTGRDTVIDLAAAHRAFARFAGPRRAVSIQQGDHVLLSAWVRSDRAAAESAIVAFLEDLQRTSGPPALPRGPEVRNNQAVLP